MSAGGIRARVRAELTKEIADVARRHLAESGAAGLSLRAVARELGMASSAVYRYFPSRDDLLTALIVDAYDAIGAAAEAADREAGPDLRERWRAVCFAVRGWALAHPHEWALVYGSPVPGYSAPRTTVQPAARLPMVIIGIIRDGLAAGSITDPAEGTDEVLHPALVEDVGLPIGPATSLGSRGVLVWSSLIGTITFEVFGQLTNVVQDRDRYFEVTIDRLGALVGITELRRARPRGRSPRPPAPP
ncbi:transcriptional regulator, TetR family [Pseudonocardia thermophila]|uniref:Transcriptional regulator, TetR family n=1 Tax=Pseudonocardia thermophila TaxID=1848 RepID=A0A1M6QCZ9_PSETH|nr:TetR/AcrR family transcriptional regulator [Pseudonocardia thermophila]SHK18058.1 transcriptional regulator, TetR family [Pseudonocardia thermophila]